MRSLRIAVFTLLFLLVLLVASPAQAFCGFYVGGADSKLFNNATQVVLMRDGNRTVLSMQNNYQGPADKFAMVVPVPTVLQKENVKTLPKFLFDTLDKLTAPRLVEYWEQDPCKVDVAMTLPTMAAPAPGAEKAKGHGAVAGDLGVTVEAQFTVGEYEIVILSAKDSGGLEEWLHQEKYEIPQGAEPYLRPYVAAGSKFFVAKVDPSKVTFANGQADLSPLRFWYDTPDFTLPVRLGLINSAGTQDLIVQILAENKRYEPANYPSVTIPTNLDLAEGSKEKFAPFYAALFDKTIEKNPKAVVTEYSWNAATCDPCPGPALSQSDFATLGADALAQEERRTGNVRAQAPKHIDGDNESTGTSRATPRMRQCWQAALEKNPKQADGTIELKMAMAEGNITNINVLRSDLPNEVGDCIKKTLTGSPSYAHSKAASSWNVEYKFTSTPLVKYRNFTITRLHARYGKDALGADIVFKEAPAIVGGREIRGASGVLEHGSAAGSTNNFQARYAIRHPWTGPIECKEPKRGIWGGPPNGGVQNPPEAARKLASVPRGGVDLGKMVQSDLSELDIKTGPPETTTTKKGGCGGCSTTPASALDFGAFVGLAAIVLRAVRRRR